MNDETSGSGSSTAGNRRPATGRLPAPGACACTVSRPFPPPSAAGSSAHTRSDLPGERLARSPRRGQVDNEKISERDTEELAARFTAHARDLFGHACVLARGDRAATDSLVQATFEAAGRAWWTMQCLADDQRRGWLRTTMASTAVSGFWRGVAFRDWRAARFGAGYHIAACLARYRTWLREHVAEDQARLKAIPASRLPVRQASPGGAGAGATLPGTGETVITGGTTRGPAGTGSEVPRDRADRDADRAVAALYRMHYRSLVRLAALLVRDVATAQDLAQDSFVAVHAAWPRLRDSDRALCYLRQSVVSRSRSVMRHRAAIRKTAPKPAADLPGAEQEAIIQPNRSALVSALRTLPARQREVVVLRCYADLSQAQIASAMGISKGAVESHTAGDVVPARGTAQNKRLTPHLWPLHRQAPVAAAPQIQAAKAYSCRAAPASPGRRRP
jgi:RNA polymerase sigma-70 factor (sigma-E family)